jgi:selenocysteine-specific elongation factor
LRERHFAHAGPEIFRAVIAHLEKTGALVSERELLRAASHTLSLSAADASLKERLEQIYMEAALEAPALDEALERAGARGGAREHGRKILQLLIDGGRLLRVQPDLFFHREALDQLIQKLRDYGSRPGSDRLMDVATFKELAGVSRKYAIPLLEYLDREHITRRAGDKRLIL